MSGNRGVAKAIGTVRAAFARRPDTCDWPKWKGGCDQPVAFYNDTISGTVGTCERHTPREESWRKRPAAKEPA